MTIIEENQEFYENLFTNEEGGLLCIGMWSGAYFKLLELISEDYE